MFVFRIENDIGKASWLTPKIHSAFREAYDKLVQSISEQNTTLKNAPSYASLLNCCSSNLFDLFFSILSKIISVSEQTINYRKDLRRIYRFYTNQQQTLKFIQDGRIKFDFQIKSTTIIIIIRMFYFSYPLSDKSLIQYTNGNPLKYPYQQQFYSSQNGSNRTQTQRK